jgi:uncharacterized protein (TIGR03437 family)
MIYTVENQLSVIVPYAVDGKTNTELYLEYLQVRSNSLTVPVGPAAPAIFTANASGRGAGAILNQDYSLNGSTTPAARGSVIQIFATGEGQTHPPGVDGKLAAAPLPVPVLPVMVSIGGINAPVMYAGGAPGLVAGIVQINAVVPQEVTPDPAVPVAIRVGDAESPAGVTVSIQ